LKLLHFADDDRFTLAVMLGAGLVEEELFVFVTSKLSAIRQQRQKTGRQRRPDDEQDGTEAHGWFLPPIWGATLVGRSGILGEEVKLGEGNPGVSPARVVVRAVREEGYACPESCASGFGSIFISGGKAGLKC